jgi:hypothetical protein
MQPSGAPGEEGKPHVDVHLNSRAFPIWLLDPGHGSRRKRRQTSYPGKA